MEGEGEVDCYLFLGGEHRIFGRLALEFEACLFDMVGALEKLDQFARCFEGLMPSVFLCFT